jgi:hypothetical protein
LPGLRVVCGDTQADLGPHLEATIFGEEDDVRRLEGVLCRKDYAAVIDAMLERRVLRAANREVPFEQFVLQRLRKIPR